MLTKPKGTYDILPDKAKSWVRLEEIIRRITKLYHYEEVRTPIFEVSEVFHRDENDTSDMVTKETYDFLDRSERKMTLRPEGTAGLARAYIENKIYANEQISKFFYMGPMFRYENMQKGRQRQFTQFGLEVYGSTSPLSDAEVISTAVAVIKAIGLKGVKVKVNSIGDDISRQNYKKVLVEYFNNYKDKLCKDCLKRLEKNPLRILDCKIDRNEEFFKNAPKIGDYLTDESKEHFNGVLEALKEMQIEYIVDSNLVRGLDYYTHTVFEIEVDVEGFGSQNVICGGGRYNNMIEEIGGPKTPAVGLAFGMERLLLALEFENRILTKPDYLHIYFISLGKKAQMQTLRLMNMCRMGGLACEMDYLDRSIKAQFKSADKYNAKFTAILGDNEVENFVINVKNNETDEQETIGLNDIYSYVFNKLSVNSQSSCQTCKEKKE